MTQPALWLIVLEWCVRLGFSLRVVMRRAPIGTSLAWLTVILLVPFAGAGVYCLLSETRLGFRRAKWAVELRDHYANWQSRLSQYAFDGWADATGDPAQLSRLIGNVAEIPPMSGNRLRLFESAAGIFNAMITDIREAKDSCNLEYYIWEAGGLADDLAEALCEASRRGVACRVLVDAVGSRGFLRSDQAKRLSAAGVMVRAALPANLLRGLFNRFDLRLHRKIAIFDQRVAYVGSQNMADPQLFNEGAGFGQWIDAMVRIDGPAVDALSMVFWEDWQLDSRRRPTVDEIPEGLQHPAAVGSTPVQVVPSGPGVRSDAISQILLNAVYMADQKLFLTTPYFVPDEALQTALISAARRGVEVTIIIPQKVNSILVRLASRPFLRELVQAGVRVAHYQAGMLHTKSVVIDDDTCMFGSLNLDPRSLHLNFEITLAIYETEFAESLSHLQNQYLGHSRVLTSDELMGGSFAIRFIENCTRLLSPLL